MTEPAILYIDDDPISRDVLNTIFSRIMGLSNAWIFPDSQNYLDKALDLPHPPNIIFLGIQVHPHDGYEMLKSFQANQVFKDSIIIAITAYVMVTDVAKMKDAGFSGLISKPIIHRIFPDLFKKIVSGEPVWYIS